ncbi:MAG: hypothetical protein LBE23_00780 [Vagococcus sp.]|nr:hypothetical protein [Vagococcus sp.]
MEIKGTTIKKELRELGHNTKKISVRVSHHGYGNTTIDVEIKDLSVDLRAVDKYLNQKYREIRYDEHVQGEILEGCNTFVRCNYEYDMFRNAVKANLPKAKKLIAEFEAEDTYSGIEFFENDHFKAYAFYKDKLISVHSKDEEDNNIYRRHVFYNEHDLARALLILDLYGNFGL